MMSRKWFRFLGALLFGGVSVIAALCPSTAYAQQEPQCPDTVSVNSTVIFYGYTYKDIDTVTVKVFQKNSGFHNPVDSFRVFTKEILSNMMHTMFNVNLGSVKPMMNVYDYSITLKNKTVFRLGDINTGIVIERHQFKRCRLVSYTVNGKRNDGNIFELAKPGYVIKRAPKTDPAPPKGAKNRMIL